MTRADFDHEVVEVWPENWPAVELFSLLETQWRVGSAGPIGLDYPVLFEMLDRREYSGAAFWRMFDDIRVLESSALEAMNCPDS